jgi:hypothetical protein
MEKSYEEEKKRYIRDIEARFNWYIGEILKRKDMVVDSVSEIFSKMNNLDLQNLRDELRGIISSWKNDKSFDSGFQILSKDLENIMKKVKEGTEIQTSV